MSNPHGYVDIPNMTVQWFNRELKIRFNEKLDRVEYHWKEGGSTYEGWDIAVKEIYNFYIEAMTEYILLGEESGD